MGKILVYPVGQAGGQMEKHKVSTTVRQSTQWAQHGSTRWEKRWFTLWGRRSTVFRRELNLGFWEKWEIRLSTRLDLLLNEENTGPPGEQNIGLPGGQCWQSNEETRSSYHCTSVYLVGKAGSRMEKHKVSLLYVSVPGGQNANLPEHNTGLPKHNTGLPEHNTGLPEHNTGLPGG